QYYHTLESRQSHLPFKHRLHHSHLQRQNDGNLRDVVVDSVTLLRESSEDSD
ncbi:7476_t:CDS:1, partial [Paraglomus brasilianum]